MDTPRCNLPARTCCAIISIGADGRIDTTSKDCPRAASATKTTMSIRTMPQIVVPGATLSGMDRRYFLGSAVAAGVALASPNDTVRVACVGFRGRGKDHIKAYLAMPNVEIAALCDIDESILNAQVSAIENAKGRKPAAYTDFRKLLEDKTIDAVSIATPNHNHTLQTIWACQAGKDVYVEKPCSHNMFEARQIV